MKENTDLLLFFRDYTNNIDQNSNKKMYQWSVRLIRRISAVSNAIIETIDNEMI